MTEQEIADYCLFIKRQKAMNTHEDMIIRSMRLNGIELLPFVHLFETDIITMLEKEKEEEEFQQSKKEIYREISKV